MRPLLFWRAAHVALGIAMLGSPSAYADPFERELRMRRLEAPIPADLDTSRRRRGRFFEVRYTPVTEDGKIPLSLMHDWVVEVHDLAGDIPAGVTIHFGGDMPQHRHGLPTRPTVQAIGPGRFRVRGVKLHMPGWWRFDLEVRETERSETLTFDVLL